MKMECGYHGEVWAVTDDISNCVIRGQNQKDFKAMVSKYLQAFPWSLNPYRGF